MRRLLRRVDALESWTDPQRWLWRALGGGLLVELAARAWLLGDIAWRIAS